MRIVAVLLASTSLVAAPAFAAEEAAPAPVAPEAISDAAAAEIVVMGQGQTRQVQELSTQELTILASGTSPLKAIEKLPSVNFQSADAFGTYEWSTRVTIRGFSQNQLGFNIDGIPLGDMSYGNANGLHISRAISPENIGVTRVSQGSGSITAQSTNNLGGTLEFFSIDPKDALGVTASASYGSENTWRGFARIGLGTTDGARAFASVQYQDGEKWKGDGKQRTLMVNAKGVLPLGGGTELDGYVSYSDRAEQDYQDLSLAMIQRLGYDWDNFGPSRYAEAVRVADIAANRGDTGTAPLNAAAGTTYPSPIASADDAYYDASGLRKDTLASLGLTTPLGDALTFKVKGYYHENDGQGTWGSPYVNSPTGVPMALRTTEYDIKRKGVFAALSGTFGINELTVGGWYEKNDFIQSRKFYAYESRTNPGRDHLKFQHNPFYTQWSIAFETDTLQYYVSDDVDLGDLKVNLGWKGYSVDTNAFALVNVSGLATGDIKVEDWFQPHVGLNYKLGDGLEAFAGFTQVTRAYQASATSGPFSTTQAGFNAIKDKLKPESSDTWEAGLRYNTGVINASLAGYYVNFRDRLLVIPTSVGVVGSANVLQNVGSVRALGIEAAVDVKLPGGFGAFASYSYNDTTYRDDVTITAGGTTVVRATAGKTVVDTPKHLLRGELSYDSQTVFGRVGVNYMSKRYFTYLNDQSVPGRALVDATIGYRLDIGQRQPVELQLNAVNLFDKRYVATIGSNGFGFSGDNQTLLAGAPRQVFVTLKAGF
ncbi:TonB-dependent receptor (plasmid) [Novosphingobium aromaticivorans DSM 12444]|uniref:TonB-dependent receptor n=1 Tax=Novosphingobium aromaticivorans (strain ATCC 700278 / DSM 12444 / CCUG 56034 / CIP 105152 / NBRC 16084 / F199) TaxID=279238 RepID=A4XEM4_NOVAD|nr:TonB-dependent receptor [Novosphingobium aromaticivorans]ABP64385.1 TonB-dependent receptor [Novosphingobium aromaticivorans DSM 12444]SCY90468.1 iron complex outermembrane recepter protein [Novosphingobium aromaticivorans]